MQWKCEGGQVTERNTFASYNGMMPEILEPERAVYRLEVNENSLNYYGMLHGGVYFTLADSAAGAAARGDGRWYVTQSASFHFLRGVKEGVVRAEAKVIRRGRSTALIRVDVTDETGRLLSTGDFSYFCVSNRDQGLFEK